ncbi:MAG: hypothetical protein ACXU84_19300, partial [Xanthobacteraceae bacterium]
MHPSFDFPYPDAASSACDEKVTPKLIVADGMNLVFIGPWFHSQFLLGHRGGDASWLSSVVASDFSASAL